MGVLRTLAPRCRIATRLPLIPVLTSNSTMGNVTDAEILLACSRTSAGRPSAWSAPRSAGLPDGTVARFRWSGGTECATVPAKPPRCGWLRAGGVSRRAPGSVPGGWTTVRSAV